MGDIATAQATTHGPRNLSHAVFFFVKNDFRAEFDEKSRFWREILPKSVLNFVSGLPTEEVVASVLFEDDASDIRTAFEFD